MSQNIPQVLADAVSSEQKRRAYNKLSKIKRQDEVRQLYFEEGRSKLDIANTLGVHRNTISNDVKYWLNQFQKNGGDDELLEFYYRQKSYFESQRSRLLKKLKTETDFEKSIKIERALLSLSDRETRLYLKFKPMVKKHLGVSKKLVKKIIQELANENYFFISRNDLIKTIIQKVNCNTDTAKLIVKEMDYLGLGYCGDINSGFTSMLKFGNVCGYLSDEEYLKKCEEIKKQQDEERLTYEKRRAKYTSKFIKKHGDPKNWPQEVKEKFRIRQDSLYT